MDPKNEMHERNERMLAVRVDTMSVQFASMVYKMLCFARWLSSTPISSIITDRFIVFALKIHRLIHIVEM